MLSLFRLAIDKIMLENSHTNLVKAGSKMVYRASWIKLGTRGKVYGRNNHSYHSGQARGAASWLGGSDCTAAGKRNDSAEVVCRKWDQSQDLLLSPAEYPWEMRSISTGNCALKLPKQAVDMSVETLIALLHELCWMIWRVTSIPLHCLKSTISLMIINKKTIAFPKQKCTLFKHKGCIVSKLQSLAISKRNDWYKNRCVFYFA